MKLADVLKSSVLARARVVAAADSLDRDVLWVHIIDLPEFVDWVRPGLLVLTTGYAWPREESAQVAMIRTMANHDLACIGLAVPHYFESMPAVMRSEAERLHLPLLEIPWDIPFVQITEAIHRTIMDEQYQVIEQSEAIYRALTHSALEIESLQELAERVGGLTRRSMTIEDSGGRILAEYTSQHHDESAPDESARVATGANAQTPARLLDYLEHAGYLRSIRHSPDPTHVPWLPQFGMPARVAFPVRIKEELVGVMWILEGDEPLSVLDERAARFAAVVAALQITRQRELASLEARLGYAFLDSLLEGRFGESPHALERAQILGFDPTQPYRAGVLVMDEPTPLSREGFLLRDQLAGDLRAHLRHVGAPPLLSLSLNHISFLLPGRIEPQRVWSRFSSESVSLALGRPFAGIAGVQKSYQEALSMQPYLPAHSLYLYETLLLPRVLQGDEEAQRAFLDGLFGKLKARRNGDVLVDTLIACAQVGFHYATAAEQLHIHPKSLHYRLLRASDISGIDLSDPDTRFRLQLAAHLLSLSDNHPG
ncbi:MAG TPA: PucR family transcriptional regulator ligand-binding domain-containing protein [Ktedonobacterales bacterium]